MIHPFNQLVSHHNRVLKEYVSTRLTFRAIQIEEKIIIWGSTRLKTFSKKVLTKFKKNDTLNDKLTEKLPIFNDKFLDYTKNVKELTQNPAKLKQFLNEPLKKLLNEPLKFPPLFLILKDFVLPITVTTLTVGAVSNMFYKDIELEKNKNKYLEKNRLRFSNKNCFDNFNKIKTKNEINLQSSEKTSHYISNNLNTNFKNDNSNVSPNQKNTKEKKFFVKCRLPFLSINKGDEVVVTKDFISQKLFIGMIGKVEKLQRVDMGLISFSTEKKFTQSWTKKELCSFKMPLIMEKKMIK